MIKAQNFFHKTQDQPFIACEKAFEKVLKREDLGFHQLPQRSHWQEAQKWGKQTRDSFDRLMVLGMGGSSLGGMALVEALSEDPESVEFWNDTDPQVFYERLQSIKYPEKTHWLVISKSGKTLEIASMVNWAAQYAQTHWSGVDLYKNMTVITQWDENPLHQWAQAHHVNHFAHPLDVGGRFSALSVVGLFPLSFAGVELDEVKNGASWARDQKILVSELSAQLLMSFDREEFVTVQWPYSSKLKSYCEWFSQLWAESLAKKQDNQGAAGPRVSTPTFCVGARDQHSVLQQMADGYQDKFIIFTIIDSLAQQGVPLGENQFKGFESLKGKTLGEVYQIQSLATREALKEKGVSQLTLNWEALDGFCMGGAMMLWELVTGVLGEVLDINAFDQPGVELGKIKAQKLLDC